MSDMQDGKMPGGSQISDMIDKLLSEPELINMVASAVQKGVAPSGTVNEDEKKEGGEASVGVGVSKDALSGLVSSLSPAISALSTKKITQSTKKSDKRDCLLVALKPYLCRERCEAIDYMIRLGKISELLRSIGGEGGS